LLSDGIILSRDFKFCIVNKRIFRDSVFKNLSWEIFLLASLTYNDPSYASLNSSSNARSVDFTNANAQSVYSVAQNTQTIQDYLHTDTNQDRFLQPVPIPSPIPPTRETPPVQPTPTQAPSLQPTEEPFYVERVEIIGSTIEDELEEEFNSIKSRHRGHTLNRQQLQDIANEITQLYVERGYITSRAEIDEKSLSTGVIIINVIQGRLAAEGIEIQGTRRVRESYVRSRILLGAGIPLNTANLEDQLRLLRTDPLFKNIEATLTDSGEPGKSNLIVRVSEAKPFEIIPTIDNYSPPSVGSERFGVNFRYRNLTGWGDEIFAAYTRTFAGGADIADVSYRIPVNPMNGTVQLRAGFNRNQVIQRPFDKLDIRGESQLYEISYRQPFIRTTRQEFALSFGFTFQDGQTFTFAGPTPFGFGPDEDGRSRTSVFKFGQEYIYRQVSGAWALRSIFSFGTGLFDATANTDPIPDSHFFSWLAQVQRVQILNERSFLIIQAELQLTPDSLLPSQQFVIGGGQSVRGYRQNVRAGDNGFRLSVENRIAVLRDRAGNSTLQLAPFIDAGAVWNANNNPNFLQAQKFIASFGLGVLWQPLPRLNLRLDYGFPLVDLDDRGGNIQDEGLYFSLNYNL
jgi:hemolysin activation/secretion protein